jgi:hypothetical protein
MTVGEWQLERLRCEHEFSHFWCHGPSCHTYKTQDRVRGTKGSKVLRTKKVKTTQWNMDNGHKYFCSTGCWNDFFLKYAQQCIAIAPRHEPLETKIEDPVREKHTHNYSFGEHSWYTTTIKKIDTDSNVG